MVDDRTMMRRAIELARVHHPHPNPRVGAVVVDDAGRVVGEGAHVRPGEPHAEVLALEAAGSSARGGTLYVTLEPCDHHGRTPPCTEAIVAAGIERVVVGVEDPDARVSGRGLARLRDAGIEVEVGVEAEAATALDAAYLHHRRTGRPRVTLKVAATLDGQAAAADGTSQWITGEAARRDGHRLRAEADAVIVGAGTARTDRPRLTARLVDPPAGRQPTPVVIAGRRPLDLAGPPFDRPAIVVTPTPLGALPRHVEQIVAPLDRERVDLTRAVTELGERGLLDLLVEGGPTLAAGLWHAGLVDRVVLYLGALVAGGIGRPWLPGVWGTLADARRLRIVDVRPLDPDVRIEAEVA